MDIVRNVQKLLYGQLSGEDYGVDVGVYSYLPRDVIFPYILISMDDIETRQNFGYDAVTVKIEIKILDRNENNLQILEISDKVLAIIISLRGIIFENLRIVSVFPIENELKLRSDINSSWSNRLSFKLAVERLS
ncbi:MAG: hypothetical protein LBI70_02070 [Rickettsiales bacterium]|jgi:hypothetical protein|nr:hypothetical protein [Rickettsiales bacterium]